jgi:hypothetical protein
MIEIAHYSGLALNNIRCRCAGLLHTLSQNQNTPVGMGKATRSGWLLNRWRPNALLFRLWRRAARLIFSGGGNTCGGHVRFVAVTIR